MNSNNVICKIRLVVDDEPHETRRVSLEIPFASDIELFKEKMRAVFPQIARTPFDITWIDSDNDIITIANQEDLQEAMMSMEGIKKFEVHSSAKQEDDPADFFPEPPMPASVVTCDVCNNRITRYRYKCMQCPDYDLCLTCEQAGNHSHHIMMRLANLEIPRFLPKIIGHVSRSARKAAHHAAKEAHRCAKATARTAASAARGATAAAASAGQYRGSSCKRGSFHEAPIPTPGCPVMDTGFIYDLASSFLGPFTQAATSATSHAGPSCQKQSEEKLNQEQKDQQPQQNAQNEKAAPNNTEGGPQIPFSPDMIGDVLKNIITAINSGVQSHASASSTGTSTPMHSTVSQDDVEIIHPSPNNTPTPSTAQGQNVRIIPMEVESNEIYPNLPKESTTTTAAPTNNNTGNNNQSAAPEPGWTIINNSTDPKETPIDVNKQASAPVAPSAPNEEDIKYAEALAQLKRMGFGENADLKNLLKRYDGNIGFVVNHLFDRGTHN